MQLSIRYNDAWESIPLAAGIAALVLSKNTTHTDERGDTNDPSQELRQDRRRDVDIQTGAVGVDMYEPPEREVRKPPPPPVQEQRRLVRVANQEQLHAGLLKIV